MSTIALSAQIDAPWFNKHYLFWVAQLNEKEASRYSLMKSKIKQQQMVLSRALIFHALTEFDYSLNSDYEIINYNTLVLSNISQTFSISITHSGTMAAIILSDQHLSLGIDIEKIKKRNFTELIEEIATRKEIGLINDRKNFQEDFYQLWTVKESLAKASQCSLTDLYQCDCSSALLGDVGTIDWQDIKYYFNYVNYQGYKGTIVVNKKQNVLMKSIEIS